MATTVEEGREIGNSGQPSGSRDFNVHDIADSESLASSEDERGRQLIEAAKRGDANLVKRLIESGVDLSASDGEERAALHRAAEHGKVEIAEMLLAKDESLVNALDVYKSSPLHIAAWHGRDKMCGLLLRHKAILAAQNESKRTALHDAFETSEKGAKKEEVVRVLMSADGSASLLDVESKGGLTPLDHALSDDCWTVSLGAWLLSMFSQPAKYFKVGRRGHGKISTYLRESLRMGYVDLLQKLVDAGAEEGKTAFHYAVEGELDVNVTMEIIQKLLDGGTDPFEGDDQGKTALHYAVEGELDDEAALQIIERLGGVNWGKALAFDKLGRNFFHAAAFLGKEELCRKLSDHHRNLIDTKDRDGRTPIFHAVAGPRNDPSLFEFFISRAQATNPVLVEDSSQTTLLHVAATRGNPAIVDSILTRFPSQGRRKRVQATNDLGQTALHKAASGGHWEVVEMLLANGAHPFEERDYEGKTALHYAAEADHGEDAVKIADLLLDKCESEDERTLLLFASTVGIGLPNSSLLQDYLDRERSKIKEPENMLRVAATFGDIDLTIACITRGANIALIRNNEWRRNLANDEENNVRDVLEQIKSIVEQGTDKPALQDNLGRSSYAIGLAAFFLNPFMRSPITVGISGEWGMGKSSVMLQTETILLNTAAELAFSQSFQEDRSMGSKSELSVTGRFRLREIANAIERLDAKGKVGPNGIERENNFTTKQKFPKLSRFLKNVRALRNKFTLATKEEDLGKFNKFLEKNQSKYQPIFKSLAIMDRHSMFEEKEETGSGNKTVGEMPLEEDSLHGITPSILTIRYNAWHYRNETEAWAGLAVEITKELEATMTAAHKLRTSWRYNWKNCRESICLNVIFPFILQVVVAIFLSVIVWLVFGTVDNKDIKKLKYGGVPASMIVAAWGLGKSVVSFVKPITSQVQEYLCLPDHSQKLGYHQKVIADINFLKEELGYGPSWNWKVFAFIWCCITWSWDVNYVPGTKIRKMPPASGNNLRMIVFVDDLDRCEESVILQVLSAVNLVLATCQINVILSMENSMIERAIIRKYGNNNNISNKSNEELADNYLRKIVQLPLHLPDPSDKESSEFLERQLGVWDGRKRSTTKKDNTHRHENVNPKNQIKNQPIKESEDKQQTTIVTPDISERSRVEHEMIEIEEQALISIDEQGDKKSSENRKSLLSIITAMLIPKYNQGERNAFRFLHTRCTRSRKLPREWKCFMTYHRLGWNIMCLSPDIVKVQGWPVQFIAWIFVCWQWRHLITTLIQKWDKLEVLIKWKSGEGPSLREIVENYIDKELTADLKMRKASGKLPEKNITDEDYYLKKLLGKVLREQGEMRVVLNMIKKRVFSGEEDSEEEEREEESSVEQYKTAEEKEEERAEWSKLRNTLRRHNVSMEGIQAFQKFRFYCQPGHLPWPLPEQD